MLQHQIEGWRSGVAGSSVRYQWVDWADINPELAVAVVAAEDQRFRQHHGLDFDAISDALEERRRDGRLRGCKARHGHTIGRAGNIVETGLMTEHHRGRIATVLAANAELDGGTRRPAALGRNANQFSDAVLVEGDEGVVAQHAEFLVGGEELR